MPNDEPSYVEQLFHAAAAHANADAAYNNFYHFGSHASHYAWTTSWSLQLRGGSDDLVDSYEKGLVLQNPPSWVPHGCTNDATGRASPCGSVQLRGGFRELDGRLVRGQESMVLCTPRERVPAGGRLRDNLASIRLQRGLCQLAGRMECRQESLVLPARVEGVPASCGWLRLRRVW
jgi:hypothetical protein